MIRKDASSHPFAGTVNRGLEIVGASVKVLVAAVVASVSVVALLLLVSRAIDREPGWIRIVIPKQELIADTHKLPPAGESVNSREAGAGRPKQCNFDSVIAHALQHAGGAGAICVID